MTSFYLKKYADAKETSLNVHLEMGGSLKHRIQGISTHTRCKYLCAQTGDRETRIEGFRSSFPVVVMSSNFDCNANIHRLLE